MYSSGQRGRAVNASAYAYGGSNPSVPIHGAVTQLVECHLCKVEVKSSSLFRSIQKLNTIMPTNIRCVCYEVSVVALVDQAIRNNWNLEQLCVNTKCGTACGMCIPYIRDEMRAHGLTGL